MKKDSADGEILTKIYGRKSFFEQARKMIDDCQDEFYILACINIDNFKVINAQYGTEVGDSVLCHVAMCVSECMAKIGGICGHIAGDDFAVLYPGKYANSHDVAAAHDRADTPECILEKMRLRVGRYIVKDSSESVDYMYDSAKIAADSIRNNYEKDIEYYQDDMRKNILHTQQIVYEMRNALDLGQFELWLQPQYNHATGAVIGSEALVRWNKNGKYISPADFVPIFEQNGFIYEMDKYIWESVCKLQRRRADENKPPLPISVNVSRRDLLHEDFIDVLTDLIKKYDLSEDLIRLEITESAFAKAPQKIIQKVTELTDLGFIVEIDDFGSGYSSLNTLKDVPSSVLKLDMRFFESTKNSQRAGNIIESVVRMAKWLGMAVIAEGVEQKEQADYLKSIGCYYIQGYYYAKPMTVESYEKLLDNSKKEKELSRMKTLKNLDNNEFWNPTSMDTLIFNSYVGGACIFEYYKGKTDVLRVNDQYIKQFGKIVKDVTQLYGSTAKKYMDDDSKKALELAIKKAIDTHEETTCEVKVTDGKHTEYLRISVRTIARTDDRILCYGVATNITERRMALINEHNMATQLDLIMRSLHASVTAAVFHDENSMEIIYKNQGFYKMHGYTKQQFEKEVNTTNDLIYEPDKKRVKDIIGKVVKTRKSQTYEFRCVKRDGSIIWVQITNSVVDLDSIGKNIVLGIATDVTNFHRLEENEANLEDKLNSIIGSANGVLNCLACGAVIYKLTNGEPETLFANESYKKAVGCSEDDFLKFGAEDYISKKDRAGFIEKVKNALSGGENFECDVKLLDKNGGESNFFVQANVKTDSMGAFLYTTYFKQDK